MLSACSSTLVWDLTVLCSLHLGFFGDSMDTTLCTDEIDDVHVPQLSDDAGSQGEWDPLQASSSRPAAAVQCPLSLSSPIAESLRTPVADTQVRLVESGLSCRPA